MKRNTFARLIVEAVEALPLRVREAMENMEIVIEQEPRRKKSGETGIKRNRMLLGLYEGTPLIRRDSGYFGVLPDKITIFQKPIEALCREGEKNVTALVREVVWHEIGHHFGLSDPELHILEQKRQPIVDPPPRPRKSLSRHGGTKLDGQAEKS